MSDSKCPKCEATAFEVVAATIQGANQPNRFVRCLKCRTVVGVLTGKDAGVLVGDAIDQLRDVQAKLDRVLSLLSSN